MRYLVTGAAGFIGARFVEMCNREEIETLSVDTLANFSRPEHEGLNFGMKLDTEDLFMHLNNDAPRHIDAIVHLGAITDTTADDIQELRRLNTDYTYELWEYAITADIPFVYASSAATYGASSNFDDNEDELSKLSPLNFYGSSKHAFDLKAVEQEKAGFSPARWVGLKFFNVYGYGESHKGRMSSMVLKATKQLEHDGSITLFKSHNPEYADGYQKRDFIYVDDVVDVIRWCIRKAPSGIYNVGTGNASTFMELLHGVCEALHLSPEIKWVDTPEDIRDQYQYSTEANMDKLRKAGYDKPFTSLKSGIRSYLKRLGK